MNNRTTDCNVICTRIRASGVPRAATRQISEDQGDGMKIANGTPGDQVPGTWRKATPSNSSGACVEVAALPGGDVAVRNSRYPSGPALVFTRPRSPRSWPARGPASSTSSPERSLAPQAGTGAIAVIP
jgi:Domain of unknown function (DUF397)